MAKLFIFGIGGTGSRVIKALSMLFASGVKLSNGFDTVVPIIIDPDTANGDLNRTKKILSLYQEIRYNIENPNETEQANSFFAQEMDTIHNLSTKKKQINSSNFEFSLTGTSNNKFKDYIGYNSLPDNDKYFLSSLFSDKNLESDLDVGFKGNPNMGSIVLNQFTKSKDYNTFGQLFMPGDAIFIINSIFGGTGAAGFPLLLKNLNNGASIPNSALITKAPKGGITYLPYFNLNKGEINSSTFLEKTKTALSYYNRTIINQNKIDALYFLGDNANTTTYANHSGAIQQKNDAHFLELAGALSIIDFCDNIKTYNGQTIVKEFGINKNETPIKFESLNSKNTSEIKLPLMKFMLFSNYLNNGLKRAIGVCRWTVKKTNLTQDYFKSQEYNSQIVDFIEMYNEWIDELADNKPAFSPFSKELKREKDYFKSLDVQNCLHINKVSDSNDRIHTQLIKLFSTTTEKVIIKNKL